MAERRLTDAWGDRWDVFQPGTNADEVHATGRLRFRHQSGRELDVSANEPLDSLSDERLLERLDSELTRSGLDRSVLRGIDARQDPEGYSSSTDRPGVD